MTRTSSVDLHYAVEAKLDIAAEEDHLPRLRVARGRIGEEFLSVTLEDVTGFFGHCGYPLNDNENRCR